MHANLVQKRARDGFSVSGPRWSGGRLTGLRGCGRDGADAEESTRIVIGADGYHSIVAKNVGATEYNTYPTLTCCYYIYWSGVAKHLPAIHPRPRLLGLPRIKTNAPECRSRVTFPNSPRPSRTRRGKKIVARFLVAGSSPNNPPAMKKDLPL